MRKLVTLKLLLQCFSLSLLQTENLKIASLSVSQMDKHIRGRLFSYLDRTFGFNRSFSGK